MALVPPPLVDLYAEHDAEVSPCLIGVGAAQTRVAVREWVLRAEAVTAPDPGEVAAADEVDSTVRLSRTLGGRGVLDADLDPLTAELFETALRVVERPDTPGEFRTAAERRGESLRRMARFVLDHFASNGDRPGRRHPHLLAVIDLPDLYATMLAGLGVHSAADLEMFLALRPTSVVEEGLLRHALAVGTGAASTLDGHRLPPDAVREVFGPGTTIERVLTAQGRILDHGREVRLADAPLRDALMVRDQGCRFPGCDAPAEWIDAHHLQHWSNGGTTALANLAGLCSSHHGVVHRDGWSLTSAPDGTLTFTRPDASVAHQPSTPAATTPTPPAATPRHRRAAARTRRRERAPRGARAQSPAPHRGPPRAPMAPHHLLGHLADERRRRSAGPPPSPGPHPRRLSRRLLLSAPGSLQAPPGLSLGDGVAGRVGHEEPADGGRVDPAQVAQGPADGLGHEELRVRPVAPAEVEDPCDVGVELPAPLVADARPGSAIGRPSPTSGRSAASSGYRRHSGLTAALTRPSTVSHHGFVSSSSSTWRPQNDSSAQRRKCAIRS